jgi:hypothetical protein
MKVMRRAAPALAFTALVVCSGCDIYRAWYERELEEVERQFDKIEGVQLGKL